MRVDAFPESENEFAAAGLVAFIGDWHIWRSNRGDQYVPIPGDWYATIRDNSIPRVYVPRTVAADNGFELRRSLRAQAPTVKAYRAKETR